MSLSVLILIAAGLAIASGAWWWQSAGQTAASREPEYHIHANLAIMIEDHQLDLSEAKYQSGKEKALDHDVHLHDNHGDVVHFHKPGISLSHFLTSIGMNLTAECLTTDTKATYCSNETNQLIILANGAPVADPAQYQPQDLDKILISYGNRNEPERIQGEMAKVNDTACIYSEKCPERGSPPEETCVGGLGSDCTI